MVRDEDVYEPSPRLTPPCRSGYISVIILLSKQTGRSFDYPFETAIGLAILPDSRNEQPQARLLLFCTIAQFKASQAGMWSTKAHMATSNKRCFIGSRHFAKSDSR